MPDNDDPFGFQGDDTGSRTVVKPMPGGMPGRTQKPLGQRPREAGDESPAFSPHAPWPLSAGGGLNAIERAASALILLLSKLSVSTEHSNPEALRERVIQEVKVFENNARMAGVTPENLYVARYVLCTAIDEAILNTPWGARSNWDMQSLLITFHKEAQGGVRFFQLLKQMSEDPRGNLDLLEVMYICLALGFKGKYRHANEGPGKLEGIKERLYREIRQQRGEIEHALAPHWQGLTQSYSPLMTYVPMWVVAAGLATLLLLLYAVFSFQLSDKSAPAYDAIASIDVAKLPQRVRVSRAPRPLPAPQPAQPVRTLADILAADISAGLLAVDEDAYRSKVVVRGDGLFRSGSTKVNPDYVDLMKRVAAALDEFPGKVLVIGHTDNIPIRTLKFPSNWHLSRARAAAVLSILAAESGQPERFEAEGRGDKEPLAPNDTKANRALNRRVEVTLLRHSQQAPPS